MKPGGTAFGLHPVWTAIVRSDSEAPTRIKGGAAFLGGVGFSWRWAVLAWAALLVAIVVSFRPAVPVIWGDTPPFLESALRTLDAGRPTVAGGQAGHCRQSSDSRSQRCDRVSIPFAPAPARTPQHSFDLRRHSLVALSIRQCAFCSRLAAPSQRMATPLSLRRPR